MTETRAWAIEQGGVILPKTVYSSRKGAIVNWLATVGRIMLVDGTGDDVIESLWTLKSNGAQAVEVTISRRSPDD